MKGFIRKGGILLVFICIFLTGCGEKLITLSEEEAAVIVNVSSSFVAKANKKQESGLTHIPLDTEEAEEVEEETQKTDTTEKNEEKTQDSSNTTDTQEVSTATVSLSEAIGLSGIEAKYNGQETAQNYVQSSFSLEANVGKTFLVLKVGLTNTTSEAISCNMIEKMNKYFVTLNGGTKVESNVTLMLNDLSTFVETVEPGATAETVLIFEMDESAVEDVQSIQLTVNKNGTDHNVNLQ